MNLNQITVPVLDIPKSIAFYESLGLNLIVHTHDSYARLELPHGDATLSLSKVNQVPQGDGIKIFFECDDLDKKVTYLKTQGVVFKNDPIDQSWLWREAHLYDPDGNHLVLYRAGENRKNPPWRK
ncbi:putative enzyme related to lactoylglutathione lyase [Nonlabens xylanidelens]|uniref:Putative enzyme related to lactoylglutathione lyase n=1 Tax=Nonlabens xylanidelens TaxID=191564 RepID=A0A2S6IIE8_9FLAO|nr:VOC family protein [Nonlabens xylanidelens]PPK93950.1 putative enzyme related to lactoylglutathione lyase [Nonlabens xylanidelens]PQJ22106.1 bleomycin resistance protein [Nonlabens xylanidelens]